MHHPTFCSSRISSARRRFSQSRRCSSAAWTEHFSMLSSNVARSRSKSSACMQACHSMPLPCMQVVHCSGAPASNLLRAAHQRGFCSTPAVLSWPGLRTASWEALLPRPTLLLVAWLLKAVTSSRRVANAACRRTLRGDNRPLARGRMRQRPVKVRTVRTRKPRKFLKSDQLQFAPTTAGEQIDSMSCKAHQWDQVDKLIRR